MNIKDYIHYYIGCDVIYNKRRWSLFMYDVWNNEAHIDITDDSGRVEITDVGDVKPILRRLEDMTEEDMIGLLQSMVPVDMEDKPSDDDYDLEMFYNDDGLMVDSDIIIGANYTCICFNGQIAIRECGSVIMFDEKDMQRPVNIPQAFHYLLKQGFDLFGLIDAGVALDAKHINK